MEYILEMKDIHKSFGPVKVLEGIDFSLIQGEVRAFWEPMGPVNPH